MKNRWKTNENQWKTSKKWGTWGKTNEKTMKTNGKQGKREENEGKPIGNKEKKGKWRKTNGKWKENLSKPKNKKKTKKKNKKSAKKNPSLNVENNSAGCTQGAAWLKQVAISTGKRGKMTTRQAVQPLLFGHAKPKKNVSTQQTVWKNKCNWHQIQANEQSKRAETSQWTDFLSYILWTNDHVATCAFHGMYM